MTKRFFKLLYALALIAIALWFAIYVPTSIRWDMVTVTSYKAKCLLNNQYVVLQGAPVGYVQTWESTTLNSSEEGTAEKEQLNFYCKYYDEIQPHIVAYNEASTARERIAANLAFVAFENGKDKVYAYPALYTLEVVHQESRPYEVYNPLVAGLIGAVLAFLLLQAIRICYVYVAFGKLVWHPFRRIENK